MTLLKIAIPTYNRAEKLRLRLDELLPQLNEEVQVHVFDNCSSDHTRQVVAGYAHAGILYSRSSGNLGMCGNFNRCFAECQSEWLWILGDDDPVQPDALERMHKLIRGSSSKIINFTTNCCDNPETRVVKGLKELLLWKDTTSLMHISSNIYKIKSLRESLKVLATSSYTYAPNIAIIYHAIQCHPEYSVELSPEKFLDDGMNPRRWSTLEVGVGLGAFAGCIQDERLQRVCALGLRDSTRWMLLWALGDINPSKDDSHWRRAVKLCNATLSVYGATFPRYFIHSLKRSRKELKRELVLQLLLRTPKPLFARACELMRRRTTSRRDLIEGDYLGSVSVSKRVA